MKVTVKDYLNVRVGKPSLGALTNQYLAPGSIIDVEDNPYTGDPYEGIDTWFRDAANNYYWTGGFTHNLSQVAAVTLVDYLALLNIQGGKPAKHGNKIRVAVLDSGIF